MSGYISAKADEINCSINLRLLNCFMYDRYCYIIQYRYDIY